MKNFIAIPQYLQPSDKPIGFSCPTALPDYALSAKSHNQT